MRKQWPAILYHLVPLIPLATGHIHFFFVGLLCVGLAYIKVQKLTAQLAVLKAEPGHSPEAAEDLRRALARWDRLTLKAKPGQTSLRPD